LPDAVPFAPADPLVRFGHFGGHPGSFGCAARDALPQLGGTINFRRRTVAGGRKGRRPAVAAALVGLVLAAAGLVPAIAADDGSGGAGSAGATGGAAGGSGGGGSGRSARPAPAADNVDRLVVRMTSPASRDAEDALASSVSGRHAGRVRPGVFDIDVARGQGPAAARKLRQNSSVAHVEADVRFRSAEMPPTNPAPLVPSGAATGSDAGAAPPPVNERCYSGCALTFDGGATSRIYSQSDFMNIGVPQAWAVTHGDPNMLVAVVDTDVDASQPDLAGKVVVGKNFSGDNTPDPEGHGTAVAGLIAAIPNNGIGIAGLGWNTKVLAVRVLDSQGAGLASKIAAGIRYAADYPGVKIVNLSLQQDSTDAGKVSTELQDAITYAQSKGLLVVAAAGNQPVSAPSYPAAFPGVLSVAAVDGSDDSLAKFSRRGPWVDIAAPGVGVLTLATPCADGNCWVTPDGTSFATPIVSASAALVWAAYPGLTAQQVAARLMSTATRVAGTSTDFSNGVVDVGRAVTGTATMPMAAPGTASMSATTALPEPTGKGYWLAASDGGIFSYGNATFLGSTGSLQLNRPIVGMAATPTGKGYWLLASDGGIFAFGDAGFYGSTGALALNKPIVGMTPTPTGRGYWLVASDGGIFAFGDAGFFGSTGNLELNKPITGMAATRLGRGYWLVASDGGIFAFGDSRFYGSTGNLRLNRPIVDMAPSPDGDGYWLVASDGGVFAFGGAAFYGSPAGTTAGSVVGLAATPTGNGYWIVGNDGSVYNFGAAPYLGGLGGVPLNRPIVGVAVR
jgi:subtilisin family serine protease